MRENLIDSDCVTCYVMITVSVKELSMKFDIIAQRLE